jgi:predicted ribosomally synthesized peptide with SipW-like signal peptide
MSFAFSKNNRQNQKFPQPNKISRKNKQILAIGGFSVLFVLSASATLLLISSSTLSFFSSRNDTSYPTSLPWVESQSQCEEFGRSWRNGQCWDREHSGTF